VSSVHWLGRLEDHPEEAHRSWLRRWSEMRVTVVLNRVLADRIVAVSDAVRASYAALAGFPAERTVVIHPGIDMRAAASAPGDRDRLRRELGVSATAPVLLNVGRLHPVKGQRGLVPAMRAIRRRHPDAVLLVAGDGELREVLTRDIATAGLDGAVRLLGTRSDVDALLAASDVLVLASESEAAPLPLFEAMRAGRPIVATDVGGVREIVEDGVNGYVVPRGDPEALAAGVLRVLGDPGGARRLGDAGRRLGAERFDIRESVRRIEAIYRALLSGRR
jgi:glycosyltransferase involved in cell wall biosynthesis